MFVELTDYKSMIKDSNMLTMIENDDQARTQAEEIAISQTAEYLYERYDTQVIFATTGSARHQYLLRCVINIVLYILHERLPKRVMPDHIRDNYRETLEYLERIADEKISANLPRRVDSENKAITKFKWGANEPRSNRF